MLKILAIGIGGFIGAVSRYWVSGTLNALIRTDLPVGTISVNILGSFLLGFLIGFSEESSLSPYLKLLLTTGILGAFTTFSTFSVETAALLQSGAYSKAILNVLISVSIGLFAAIAGLAIGRIS